MGNIRLLASSLFALSTLVACGDDGGSNTPDALVIVDAPPVDQAPPIDQPQQPMNDLTCAGNTTPPAASATITITGTVSDVTMNGLEPMAGAVVKACKGDCLDANLLATATPNPTDDTGNFSTGALTAGGNPIDGYLMVTATGHWPTRVYPFAALTSDVSDVPAPMVTQQIVTLLGFLGLEQDPGNGIVAVVVTDCSATPTGVGGATVQVFSGSTEVGDDALDVAATLQDDTFAGTYFIGNVPPGDVVVKVSVGSTNFLENTATVVADGVTGVQVRPGY